MEQERIHIKPIRAEHHKRVSSVMGTTYKKGHKLGEAKIKKAEIEYEE